MNGLLDHSGHSAGMATMKSNAQDWRPKSSPFPKPNAPRITRLASPRRSSFRHEQKAVAKK